MQENVGNTEAAKPGASQLFKLGTGDWRSTGILPVLRKLEN